MDIDGIVEKAGSNVPTVFNEKSAVITKTARTRKFVRCFVCSEFEEEAIAVSGNSRVYLGCDVTPKKVQVVIDHIRGTTHAAATEKRMNALWDSRMIGTHGLGF